MIDYAFAWLLGRNLLLLGAVLFALLSVAGELGFRVGAWRVRQRPCQDRELAGVSTFTGGMLALLAFTLGLTISFAQDRFEARRALVVQEANAIGTAWLRAGLVTGDEGPAMTGWIEDYAKVRLAYTIAESTAPEPRLIAETKALQTRIWEAVTRVARRDPTPVTSSLIVSLNEMFDSGLAQRFAYDSRGPVNLTWMLLIGSLLAIGAMNYQLGLSGVRQIALTSLLLVMWSGGMVLITDLNRARLGSIRVDPAPLVWTIQGFTPPSAGR